MVCLPCIFTYVRFLSHKHCFKAPLILSLHHLWNCFWGLESTVPVPLEVRVPGRFHLNHPAIKHFPPLSYLVIYHQLWSGVMYHLCETLLGEAVNVCLHKQRRMTLICALARPASRAREAPALGPSAVQCTVESLRGSSPSISLFPGMALFCLGTETLIALGRLWSSF